MQNEPGRTEKLKITLWEKLREFGNHHYSQKEEKKANSVLNAGFLTAISFFIALLFITTAAVAYCLTENFDKYLIYLVVYIVPEIAIIALLSLFLYLKNKYARNNLFQFLGFIVMSVFYVYMGVSLGKDAGYYLWLATMVPMPFLFYNISRLKILFYELALFSFTVITAYLLIISTPYYPCPRPLEALIFRLTSIFWALSFFFMFVYFWWKYDFTRMFLAFYNKFSNRGSHRYSDKIDIKFNIIANRLIILCIALYLFVVTVASTVCFYLHMINFEKTSAYVCIYLPIPVLCILLLLFFNYLKNRTGNIFFNLCAFLVNIVFIIIYNMFLGTNGGYQVFSLVTLPVPFFIFSKKNIGYLLLGEAASIASIIFNFYWNATYAPMYPVPGPNAIHIFYILVFSTTICIFAECYYLWTETIKTEEMLFEEQRKLAEEKRKSDSLLLNILPAEIAEELKEKGSTKSRYYENVSVLFTDFAGFTNIAEKLSPEALVQDLDQCFSHFDSVTGRFNLEKLKTIGDSYMCAGGIPADNYTHPIDCVLAALEFQAFMNKMKVLKEGRGLLFWEIRLGINTGPLVAGVVGKIKFAYDIWGDTVNTASRMESSGEPGRVNISASTYEVVKSLFQCEYRGKILAKRKGEIDMYFVNGIKPEYSVGGEGKTPNHEFEKLYAKIGNGEML